MERVGAGNFIGSATGNVSLDDASGGAARATGSVTSFRGRQESPFDGGARSFLSSTHLRPVENLNEAKGSDKALLGEVLGLLKQVISLVEQLFANKAEGASPSSGGGAKLDEAPSNVANTPSSSVSDGAPAGNSTSALIAEVLSLLQSLIGLLEQQSGSGSEAKPGEGVKDPSQVDGPSSSSSDELDVLSQVLELVSQLIELIQQRFDSGSPQEESLTATEGGNTSALQDIADIKGKLEDMVNQAQGSNGVPEETLTKPDAPVEPAQTPDVSGPSDADILAQIVGILNSLVSLLQQLSGAPAEAAE